METKDIGIVEDEPFVSKSGTWSQAHMRVGGNIKISRGFDRHFDNGGLLRMKISS